MKLGRRPSFQMTSPMPQIHSPQIILLSKQPIPSRIDVLRPRHRKAVPSTCVREPPESCHDWNNLWRDFKSDKSDAQLSRSRIKTDVPTSIKPGPRAQLQSSKSNAPNTKSINNTSLPAQFYAASTSSNHAMARLFPQDVYARV